MNAIGRALRGILVGLLILTFFGGACLGEGANGHAGLASSARGNDDPFAGEWCEPNAGRAWLTIEPAEGGYAISIYWSGSATRHSEWYMTGAYDAASGSINCDDCRCLEVSYDEDGVAHEELMYTGGKARFARVNDEIHWYDAQEDAGGDIVFAYVRGADLGYCRVVNCNDYVSLRSAPSTAAPVIATIPLGAEVEAYLYDESFCECSYRGETGYVLADYLECIDAGAKELTSEQLDYLKGALFVPRDIVVTSYDYEALDSEGEEGRRFATVNLYSNGTILAGATIDADALTPEGDVWEYSPSRVNDSSVAHQAVSAWSEADQAYLKGGFGIPWNVAAHCDVGESYLWEAGETWLTPVRFYAGEECHADTVMEELLAGAAMDSDFNCVTMVRDIYGYLPD